MSGDHDLKHAAALGSIAASAGLTLAKFAAGLASGSLALVSEAAHGAVDTGATIVTWLAVRESGKPADDDHHFGHEKFEALAALFESFLLFGVSLFVVVEAFKRAMEPDPHVDASLWAFGALGVSIVVDLVRWRSLRRIAAETKSEALAADATHFSSDLGASLIVAAGLVGVLLGWRHADAAASFGVAGFIAVAGYRLARRTVDTLLDTAPDGLAPRLRAAVADVAGVADVDDVRLRRMGGRIVGELTFGVARSLPMERVDQIKAAVRRAIGRIEPDAAVTLTAAPRALDTETLLERVLIVAARRRAAVHHVMIQTVGERVSIGFDLEVDGRMSLGDAHDVASALETNIRAELGGDVEVDSHIEPQETRELEGQDAAPAVVETVAAQLSAAAAAGVHVHDVHQVRVRETAAGLVVNYHCRAAPTLSVAEAHAAVDELERAVRRQNGAIARLVGHAEPPRRG